MLNNDTISDDEVVASYVPPRYLFINRLTEKIENKCLDIFFNFSFDLGFDFDFFKFYSSTYSEWQL